jgi:putative ABC transport system permease protein
MNTQIILAGLKARPVRTAVGVLAVTLEVVLILLLVGLTNGAITDSGNRIASAGGEIIFLDGGASMFIAMNPATLPIDKLKPKIAQTEGVKAVAPILTQTEAGGGFTMIWAIDPPSFDEMSGGLTYIKGKVFSRPDEAVVDDRLAGDKGLDVGSPVTILKRPFTVSGIVQNGKGARAFIPLESAYDMIGRSGFVTMFYIKVHDRSQTKQVIERLKTNPDFEGKQIVDAEDWLSLMYESNAPLLGIVFRVIVFIGVAIGILVIFLSMYTTVTERTREIGILRSMGASKGYIVVMVLQESLVLCAIGCVIGIGMSYVVMAMLKSLFPTLSILISYDWVLRAAIFALLSGIVGSLYPAYKAASQDPIEALAYE